MLVGTISCGTPYVKPAGDEVASIQFIDETQGKMSVHFYQNSKKCTDRITAVFVKPKSSRTFDLVAGKSQVFSIGIDSPGAVGLFTTGSVLGGVFGGLLIESALEGGCSVTLEFVPESNHKYVFLVLPDGEGCGYQLFEKPVKDAVSNKAKPVSFKKREWIRANTSAGPFCK